MTKKKGAPAPADELRRCAEERLVTRGETTADMQANLLKLVHELQVHQIELEMQNDALVAAQAEIEDGQRFTDLYEFAPVAFFSIDPDTSIRLLNQAAASTAYSSAFARATCPRRGVARKLIDGSP